MIYVLLTLIAVGVLLISNTGQEILKIIFIILLIGGGIYIIFWTLIIIWGLLNTDTSKSFFNGIGDFVKAIIIIFCIYYGSALIVGFYVKIKENLKNKINIKHPTIIPFFKKNNNKIIMAIWIAIFLGFTLLLILIDRGVFN